MKYIALHRVSTYSSSGYKNYKIIQNLKFDTLIELFDDPFTVSESSKNFFSIKDFVDSASCFQYKIEDIISKRGRQKHLKIFREKISEKIDLTITNEIFFITSTLILDALPKKTLMKNKFVLIKHACSDLYLKSNNNLDPYIKKKHDKYIDYVLVNTVQEKKIFCSLLGVTPEKVFVSEEVAESLPINYNYKKIGNDGVLYSGVLNDAKSILSVLQTATQLPDIKFTFMGTGKLQKEIMSYSEKYSNVIFKPIPKLKDLMTEIAKNKLTVVVNTERKITPDSFIAKQSLMLGIPIISINNFELSTKYIGANNERGILLENKDNLVNELVKNIKLLLVENQELYMNKRTKCFEYAKNYFDPIKFKNNLQKLETILKE